MRRSVVFSQEKSLRRQEVCTAIGRQLRDYYDAAQSLSGRLADLVKKIEQSSYDLSFDETKGAPQSVEDA